MAKRISVVVSQGQSHNPRKRQLEEDLVAALMMEPDVDVTVISNLYDLQPDGTGVLALEGIRGEMVVLSWLFHRAARWTLDRNGIRGQEGDSPLNAVRDPDEDVGENESDENESDGEGRGNNNEALDESESGSDDKPRVIDARTNGDVPSRTIYCIELTASESAADFLVEIRRIVEEASTQVVELGSWLQGSPSADSLQRFENPTNDTALGALGLPILSAQQDVPEPAPAELQRADDDTDRRWYPVIDFGRCTNCMECIDFCLFGVYGVDAVDTILVEQPDNCRKGCPACSRVCPENAIIFPQHKSPAIAGAPAEIGTLKIDLSRLFGAPDAADLASRERDEQLVMAGREAVGTTTGIPKRQADSSPQPRDELDDLMDGLDDFDA